MAFLNFIIRLIPGGLGSLAVSITVSNTGSPAWTRHVLPTNAQRVARLATHALQQATGLRVAILAPAKALGRGLASEFARVVGALGGRVVAEKRYAPRTTDFSELAIELSSHDFDALFIPDRAKTLALIAPALGKTICKRDDHQY